MEVTHGMSFPLTLSIGWDADKIIKLPRGETYFFEVSFFIPIKNLLLIFLDILVTVLE